MVHACAQIVLKSLKLFVGKVGNKYEESVKYIFCNDKFARYHLRMFLFSKELSVFFPPLSMGNSSL